MPVGITGDFRLKSQTTLLTLAGTWQFVTTSERSLRMVFGARVYHNPQQLDWRLSAALPGFPALSGTSNVARTDWNAIIGFSGRQRFGSDLRWFMPWYVDAGAGDSRFTGQALLGIGYAFDWGDVAASWRYIDYVFRPGSLISRVAYSGPAVGLTWRF